ncbi:Alpha-ribazole phosphatase [Aquimixticola soesokkakensis]|uniref:Alpha-ribazole phosphatase n=1 Tax=Aquimixticola soesokkakensis TaxID=1519096 RepID=A0A1Y5T0L8_9RHOB|nr:histidine phosphatase family protein [Aquimixticola soesokkakensis]SLN53235.1 Alpha-ribazole phosphatase [Aquimixticola soesokkakensis]
MTLWLVRHGPTHARQFVGWTDVPADLSDTAALARLEAALPQAPVVSSDLMRAVTTADAIAARRRRLPHSADLRETHFGVWENKTWAEVQALDPDLPRAYFETPGDIAPPQGESWNRLCARTFAAADALLASHGEVVIVAHMGVIMSFIQRARACSAYEAFAQTIDPLSLTVIDTNGAQGAGRDLGRWQLRAVNQTL